MDYELAKQLKDAGFKQGDGAYVYKEDHCWLDEEYQGTDGYEAYCYMPELSELIEACGENFRSLHYMRSSMGKWAAEWQPEPLEEEYVYGSTPEEAVARLYLALNKK